MRNRNTREPKNSFYLLLAFVAFLYSIYLVNKNYQEYISLKSPIESQTQTIVYGKTAVQHLFSETSYVALTKPGFENFVAATLNEDQTVYVEREEWEALQKGSTIHGYEVDGIFYTNMELKEEVRWQLFGVIFMSLYPVGYIVYWFCKIKFIRLALRRLEQNRMADSILSYVVNTVVFGGIIALLLFVILDFGSVTKRVHDKITADDLMKADAVVTARDIGYNSSRYADSEYYLAINFQSHRGRDIHLTKQVTFHTFKKYESGTLPIFFKKDDPYTIYLQKVELKDVLQIAFSATMIMYYCAFFVSILLGWVPFLLRKRKNAQEVIWRK